MVLILPHLLLARRAVKSRRLKPQLVTRLVEHHPPVLVRLSLAVVMVVAVIALARSVLVALVVLLGNSALGRREPQQSTRLLLALVVVAAQAVVQVRRVRQAGPLQAALVV
jgi:hypothetical protein